MPSEPPKNPTPGGPRPRSLLPLVLVCIGVLLIILIQANTEGTHTKPWSEIVHDISEGRVTKIEKGRTHLIATITETKDGKKQEVRYRVKYPFGQKPEGKDDENLNTAIEIGRTKIPITEDGDTEQSVWTGLLPQIVFFAVIVAILWLLVFRRMGQGGGVLSFGKSRATLVSKGKATKTFKDVAGIDEAKEEVEELVDFLRNPRKFQKLGGRIPKGVLLVGPPGTGKTLLAKAIAGEADVPFYNISGSDFVEMFVGVGASRVRDLFQQAKDNSPCIIFIDEIDAVARRRSSGFSSGGHDEREQTLNAILVEMDGFSSNEKVIVLAATNRVDVLDPALIRPGRFDRHIHVDLPDINGREQILQVHAHHVKLAESVDLALVAKSTPGFSGADLENLINEAALHAARQDRPCVVQEDMEYARDRIAFGREKKTGSRAIPEQERRMTAFHEAGHAVVQHLLPEVDPLHKVTIIPRGKYLGATFSLPDERRSMSSTKMRGLICMAMGGRVAESRFFNDLTTGARQDIAQATALARDMVLEYGMSERMGPVRYTSDTAGWGGPERTVEVSEQTRRELDDEVRRLVDEQFRRCEAIIAERHDTVVRLAEALLEHETLTAEQVKVLVDGGSLEPRTPTLRLRKAAAKADTPAVTTGGATASGPAPQSA